MKTLHRLLLCSAFALLLSFSSGCGIKSTTELTDTPLAVTGEWTDLSELDTALAHALPSDAPDLAEAAKTLSNPPAGIKNATIVATMVADLKQLGTDLAAVDPGDEQGRTVMIEAMYAVTTKTLTEAGLDVHNCEDHGGHGGHGATTESGDDEGE